MTVMRGELPSGPLALSKDALDFAPGLLAIQESPPARMPRAVLYALAVLLALTVAWAALGHLDVVATANGRLVPKTYLKVVQPADAGIVKEILVHEGEHVSAGEVLLRMDAQDARADTAKLRSDLAVRSLQLRRIYLAEYLRLGFEVRQIANTYPTTFVRRSISSKEMSRYSSLRTHSRKICRWMRSFRAV